MSLSKSAIISREYREKHPDSVRKSNAKYKFKRYLRDYAELEGLNELLEIIKKRKHELTNQE